MEITVTFDDARVQRGLTRLDGDVRKAVEAALARGARDVADDARRTAAYKDSTANLKNSILATRIGDLHYRVAPGVSYAAFVERGVRPGKQPGTAKGLMEWVKQKTGLEGVPLDRKTFVIARAIGRRGIKPAPFMKPALDSNRDRLIARVRESAQRAVQEAFRG